MKRFTILSLLLLMPALMFIAQPSYDVYDASGATEVVVSATIDLSGAVDYSFETYQVGLYEFPLNVEVLTSTYDDVEILPIVTSPVVVEGVRVLKYPLARHNHTSVETSNYDSEDLIVSKAKYKYTPEIWLC